MDATTTWSSSDSSVASVDANGLITGIAAGIATITATASSNDATASATSTIAVNARPFSLPEQLNRDDIIGVSGAQKVFFSSAATITSVIFYGRNDPGSFCCAQSYVKLYRDNNNNFGDFVTSTSEDTIGQYDTPRELVYTFSSPVSLEASSSYWFSVEYGPFETTNGTQIYGSSSDPYPDGYYSGGLSKDAYFRFVQ